MISNQEINQQFLQLAAEHGLAYANGNYKIANKIHRKLHELYDIAKSQKCQDVFKDMIDNENENVQLWAAIFTLKTSTELAVATLERLAENSNIKMTAKTTLSLWIKGKLNMI